MYHIAEIARASSLGRLDAGLDKRTDLILRRIAAAATAMQQKTGT
jgi:hypothetical protein